MLEPRLERTCSGMCGITGGIKKNGLLSLQGSVERTPIKRQDAFNTPKLIWFDIQFENEKKNTCFHSSAAFHI